MNKYIQSLTASAAVLAAVFGLTGCSGDYNGGGVIPSASGVPGEIATFGFTIHAANDGHDCDNITSVTGQLQFNDHGTGMALHAKMTDFAGGYGDANGNYTPLFIGDYYIKGKKQGSVLVAVIDYAGSKEDLFFITVLDGPYLGYTNQGVCRKGNITYVPDSICQ